MSSSHPMLLVEDSPEDREATMRAFKKAGLANPIHCCVDRLREQPQFRLVLLVALTGYGQEEDRQKSREAGFDHHLVKPVDPAELQQLIARKAEGIAPRPVGTCAGRPTRRERSGDSSA